MHFSASKIQTIFGVKISSSSQVAVFINMAELKTIIAETLSLQMKPAWGPVAYLESTQTCYWASLKILCHHLFCLQLTHGELQK